MYALPSLLLLPSILANFFLVTSSQNQPSCSSKIYCQGDLLHTVQMSRPFNDSKTFVDMRMRFDEPTTLDNFQTFYERTNRKPSRDQIRQFVDDNFEHFDEFDQWTPPDFNPNPSILAEITDGKVAKFTKDLVQIWPTLARKVKRDIIESPDRFTLIPVQNGFIIPGGRFKEFYYWDSYWIIRGLLICEMTDTVRGMLENFLHLVQKYGFIPNGSRIYYLNRSQPPLLTLMVDEYYKATSDFASLQKFVPVLNAELEFWLKNRLVKVQKNGVEYVLARYDSESGSPRPESYYEDVRTAGFFPSENEQKQVYADLKSGAESGIDFSTRWIIDSSGGNDANITFIKTRQIVPVDLNAFLCQAFEKLAEFYDMLNNVDKAIYWRVKATIWKKAIQQVFYHSKDGIWYDWDLHAQKPRRYFFPTNFAPLWTGSIAESEARVLGKRAARYFRAQGIPEFQGGIPASLSQSGEQWDYPNAWPPLQSIVILGLDRSGDKDARNLAADFANRWLDSNLKGFDATGMMFEKYDALTPGQNGGGGEYVIQSGFGWTNGVVFELIERYYTNRKGAGEKRTKKHAIRKNKVQKVHNH